MITKCSHIVPKYLSSKPTQQQQQGIKKPEHICLQVVAFFLFCFRDASEFRVYPAAVLNGSLTVTIIRIFFFQFAIIRPAV